MRRWMLRDWPLPIDPLRLADCVSDPPPPVAWRLGEAIPATADVLPPSLATQVGEVARRIFAA